MAQQRRTLKKEPAKTEKTPVETKVKKSSMPASTKKEIMFIIIFFSTILLILGLYGTSLITKEPTSAIFAIKGTAILGPLGLVIKWLFMGLLGPTAYILPVLTVATAIYMLKTRNSDKPRSYIYVSGVIFTICIAALFYVFQSAPRYSTFRFTSFWTGGTKNIGGGILGTLLGYPLVAIATQVGATIILIAFMLISFIAMTDFAITRKLASMVRKARESGIEKADREDNSDDKSGETSDPIPKHPVTEDVPKKKKKNRFTDAGEDIVPFDGEKDPYVSLTEEVDKLPYTGEKAETKETPAEIKIYSEQNREKPVKPFTPPKPEPLKDDITVSDAGDEEILPDGEVIVKPKRLEGEIQVEISRENVEIPYTFPDTTLLNNIDASEDRTNPQALRELSVKLVETLKSFNIEVKVLEISKGPAITRFELQPTAGVRVSKITSLADDIALSLAATAVRIEAPIPGKAAIGIEIPNESVATVSARDVLESREFTESKSKLSIALGRDIAGKCIVGDIAKMPHVLIAGATGSGKSVCINSLIASILYKASPNEVKLIMIDPKVVELSVYNGIPHLLIPVVTDPRKAAGSLNWAVQEMSTRYKFFADEGVRDLKGYNALMEKEGRPRLPQIVIIIDELADLMMVAPKDVETYICRLAQLARAAGMHLVIATQRPSVNVITGVIKANIPSRIAFAVSSYIDSRTILDTNGAEKLLGRGDMLYYPMGANKPTRVQGAFISDEEVERLVEFVKKDSEAVYDEDVLEQLERAGEESSDGPEEDEAKEADALLPQAIEIVIDSGQASVSLVQRKLSVGYARAGRLVDQMEARGIVGPSEGSKPRRVLVTKAEYLAMLEGSGLNASQSASDDEIIPAETEYTGEDVYIPEEDLDEDDIIIPPPGN